MVALFYYLFFDKMARKSKKRSNKQKLLSHRDCPPPIEMPFGGLTHVGQSTIVLDRVRVTPQEGERDGA